MAFWAEKLNLPVNPDKLTTQREASRRMKDLLTLSDGHIVPDPFCMKDDQFSVDMKQLPQVTYGDLYQYLVRALVSQ